MAKRRLSILGSTGSVGCNTIDLITRQPDAYDIVALSANENFTRLAEQTRLLQPEVIALANTDFYTNLKQELDGVDVEILGGAEGVVEAAKRSCDWTMASIVGAAGLKPTLAAIGQGKTVAFANKECLVCAGDLVMAEVLAKKTTFLPVDSEHNAIYQVFCEPHRPFVKKLILTASGGPFRKHSLAEMSRMTPQQAILHPNWTMGAKISVDSATMMNKGLEIIEAHHLFGMTQQKVDILVHPQSIVHSMVEYADGSVLAQLGTPDMRTPIGYCLAWPNRMHVPTGKLDFTELARLDFEAPDPVRFPALRLVREAIDQGGAMPVILNAANEISVSAFLEEKIGFLDIVDRIEDVLCKLDNAPIENLDDVIEIDRNARAVTLEIIG